MNVVLRTAESSDRTHPMSAVVVYEDPRTHERAMIACDTLVNRFWPEVEFKFHWWPSDFLEDPGMAAMAAPDAAQSDIFIFCGGPEREMSSNVVHWFETWAERRNSHDGAIVDITETTDDTTGAAAHKKVFLREIARRATMGYLSKPIAEIANSLPFILEDARKIAPRTAVPQIDGANGNGKGHFGHMLPRKVDISRWSRSTF